MVPLVLDLQFRALFPRSHGLEGQFFWLALCSAFGMRFGNLAMLAIPGPIRNVFLGDGGVEAKHVVRLRTLIAAQHQVFV